MNSTLSDQIKAIQEARVWIKGTCANDREFKLAMQLDPILNDAGTSLAAMNLDPDSKEKVLLMVNECLEGGITIEKDDPIHQQIKKLLTQKK